MGANTKIEWCHHTFNCWRGCTKVSEACRNCYAEKQARRNPHTLGVWGDNGTRVVAAESAWKEPLKWDRAAKDVGVRHRVFCASMADVFEDWRGLMAFSDGDTVFVRDGKWTDNADPDTDHTLTMQDVRSRLFELIDATPNLDWLLLTKRPENIAAMMPQAGFPSAGIPGTLGRYLVPNNLWIGVTVENQQTADERIPHLLRVPAVRRFVSCEPLLGPVDLEQVPVGMFGALRPHGDSELSRIDWVIAGGESGPNARPSHPDWFRSLRDQCVFAGVPYFFKQWGEWAPPDQVPEEVFKDKRRMEAYEFPGHAIPMDGKGPIIYRIGKAVAGRLIDGREWNELPK